MNASPLERLQWAAAVAADFEVGDRAKAMAAVFAFVLNSKSGVCFHSMATLARLTSKCERSTRLAVRELEDAGWLACKKSKGRVTNIYAPNFERSSAYVPFPDTTMQEDAGFTQQDHAGIRRLNSASDGRQLGKLVSPTRQGHAPKQENKNNKAFGSAPKGAQAKANQEKTEQEGMTPIQRGQMFASILAKHDTKKPVNEGRDSHKPDGTGMPLA